MPHYTDDAKKVLEFDRTEARNLNSEFIGTEHILLGIADLQEEADGTILPFVDARRQILKEAGKLTHPSTAPTVTLSDLPASPRTKRVLHFAEKVSEEQGRTEICSTALLIGLLQEREGIAHQILRPLIGDLELFEGKLLASMGSATKEDRRVEVEAGETSDLSKIRDAIHRFISDPDFTCSDCGKCRRVKITGIGGDDPVGATWKVMAWRFDGRDRGWVVVSEEKNKKLFCPTCAAERGIDFNEEREKNR